MDLLLHHIKAGTCCQALLIACEFEKSIEDLKTKPAKAKPGQWTSFCTTRPCPTTDIMGGDHQVQAKPDMVNSSESRLKVVTTMWKRIE